MLRSRSRAFFGWSRSRNFWPAPALRMNTGTVRKKTIFINHNNNWLFQFSSMKWHRNSPNFDFFAPLRLIAIFFFRGPEPNSASELQKALRRSRSKQVRLRHAANSKYLSLSNRFCAKMLQHEVFSPSKSSSINLNDLLNGLFGSPHVLQLLLRVIALIQKNFITGIIYKNSFTS